MRACGLQNCSGAEKISVPAAFSINFLFAHDQPLHLLCARMINYSLGLRLSLVLAEVLTCIGVVHV